MRKNIRFFLLFYKFWTKICVFNKFEFTRFIIINELKNSRKIKKILSLRYFKCLAIIYFEV